MIDRAAALLTLVALAALTASPKTLHAAWSGGELEPVQTLPQPFDALLQSIPARAMGADGNLRDGLYLHVRSANNSSIALWFTDGTAVGTGRIGEIAVSQFSSAVWPSPGTGAYFHGYSPTFGPTLFHAEGPQQAPTVVNTGFFVPRMDERLLGVGQHGVVFRQAAGATTATLLGIDFSHREVSPWAGGTGNLEPDAINANSMYFYSHEPPLKVRRLDLATATLLDLPAPANLGSWQQSHQIAATDQFVCLKEQYLAPSFMYVAYCENTVSGLVSRVMPAGGDAVRQLDFGSNFRRIGSRMLFDGFEVIAGQQSSFHRLWSNDGNSSLAVPLSPPSTQVGAYCTAARDGKFIRSINAAAAGGPNGFQLWQFDGTAEGSTLLADLPFSTPNCRGNGAWLPQRNLGVLDTGSGLQVLDANSETMTAFSGFPQPVTSTLSIERVGSAIVFVTLQTGVGLQIWRYVPGQIFAQGFD